MSREYTTNTQIREDIKDLRGDISSLREDISESNKVVAVLEEHIQPFCEQASRHERILNGPNGDPGLIAKVDNHEEKLNNIQWWFRATLGVMLGDAAYRIVTQIFS